MTARHRVDLAAFDGLPLFDRYPARALAPLAPYADRLAITPGVTVAHEGRHAREVIVVVSGEVLVSRQGRPVGRLGPGAVIGAREQTAGTPHDATYVAGPGVAALALTPPAFRWAVQMLTGLGPALGLAASSS